MYGNKRINSFSGFIINVTLGLALPGAAIAQVNNQQGNTNPTDSSTPATSTTIEQERPARVFSPTSVSEGGANPSIIFSDQMQEDESNGLLDRNRRQLEPAEPGEFEEYVQRVLGRELPIFGADLVLPENRDFAVPATATIPPDYRLNVGDVVSISMAGSVDGSVERVIDTNGNIFLPNVGNLHVAGVRHGDLLDYMADAIGTQFRNFRVGVRVTELRGIRVYVTGFANNPGAYSVSSLSSLANAIFQAGGPSTGGSMRRVKLIRNGREVGEFDLYELIRGGNRIRDFVLENEDVLLIPPVGRQVAAFGSVNQEAIYELLPHETVGDIVDLAGGVSSLGDPSRLLLYRAVPEGEPGPRELAMDTAHNTEAQNGDLVQILGQGDLVQPLARQSILVRIEGEVVRPGNYFVPANTPLATVLEMAGGLTSRAFPFGTQFVRESVRAQQQESFFYAIDQVELTLASAPLTADSSIPQSSRDAQIAAARAMLENLREAEPDGRLVLDITAENPALPLNLTLENNDRIYIPATPSSIGVFGAIYRPASFMIGQEPRRVRDYVGMAGGTLSAADRGDIFVVRANGEVVTRSNGAMAETALPGDVVFVPVRANSTDLLGKIAQISTVLFQLGIAAATVMAIN